MIAIQAYRASIGSFCSKAQRHRHSPQLSKVSILPDTSHEDSKFISGHNAKQYCFLKTFCAFLFVAVLYLNVNIAVFKLVDGDIESNPGPNTYIIQRSVQGSFHQPHPKFGETSGIQCACNSLFAICWSSIKRVSIWKSWDLDYVLEYGNALFKDVNILRPLSMKN